MSNKETKIKKKCFVIAPIGGEGSEIRERSDKILEHIIKPTVGECGYEAIRSDKISEPGIITSQIIQHLIDDDLVIADLTGRNPNAYYELAIRHIIRKPIVQIIQSGETIPFDISTTRTIHVDHRDLNSVANCKCELVKQIRFAEKEPSKADSPISLAIDLEILRKSKNPLEKSSAEIISMLQDIRLIVNNIKSKSIFQRTGFDLQSRWYRRLLEELFKHFESLAFVLNLPHNEKLNKEHFKRAQLTLINSMRTLEMLAM